jgi:hypothetical protein
LVVAVGGVLLISKATRGGTEEARVAEAGGSEALPAEPTPSPGEPTPAVDVVPDVDSEAAPEPAYDPQPERERAPEPPTRTFEPVAVPEPLEPSTPPASPQPRAVEPEPVEGEASAEFGSALATALGAIEEEQWDAAQAALDRAEAARPGTPEVAEARARVADGATYDALELHMARAGEALTAERWRNAAREFEAALALEPTLTRARTGVMVAEARAEMAELIDYHLANPDRLVAADVLAEAEGLLEEASEVASPGEHHQRQTAALRELLSTARIPVRVLLRSDDLTEVLVYKVGRLGTFDQRELELRPGLYTIVGSRTGYRDVRHQLRVKAGEVPEPLVVRCEEKI